MSALFHSGKFLAPMLAVLALLSAASSTPVLAADEIAWEVPPEKIELDYTSDKLKFRDAFADDGLAREVVLLFPLIGRDRVTIHAKLPGEGKFVIEMTSSAKAELKKVDDLTFEVAGSLKIVTPKQVRNEATGIAMEKLAKERSEASGEANKKKKAELEAYLRRRDRKPPDDEGDLRNAYADRRAIELGKDTVKEALEEIAKQRPEWASKTEQQEWTKLDDGELFEKWLSYLELDLAHGHLKGYGIDIDRAQPGSKNAIGKKFLGVYALLAGLSSRAQGDKDTARSAAIAAMRSLATDDTERLRKHVVIELHCQYRPTTSDKDANSQWFHAQRVKCLARGVSTIRLEGELDPKEDDGADWWTLVDFDPRMTTVHAEKDAGYRHEVIADKQGISRMRVVAVGDKPVKYSIELRPVNAVPGGKPVVVREAPIVASASFPY
jgi:hypothetical protein